MQIIEYTSEYRDKFAKLVNDFNNYIVSIDEANQFREFKDSESLLTYTDQLIQDSEEMNGFIYLATVNDKPVGFIQGVIKDNSSDLMYILTHKPSLHGWIGVFYVSAENRGLGIGKALFEKTKAYFVTNKCTAIRLYVLGCNELAMKTYHAIGMKPRHIEMDLEI